MEFFEGWKALNSRLDNSDLPALTQLVALKLFVISDERRFPVSISVSDRELMQRTGIPSKHTIHDARLRLKRAGLIEFTTQPCNPTQYRWTLKAGNAKGTLREHLGNDKGTLEADSYIRVRDPYTPNPYPLNQSIACEKVKELDALLDYWERDLHGGRLSFEHQSKLSALLKAHGLDWLKAAMTEAADANNNPRGLSPKFLFSVIARKDKAAAPEKPAPKKSPPLNDYEALRQKLLGGD